MSLHVLFLGGSQAALRLGSLVSGKFVGDLLHTVLCEHELGISPLIMWNTTQSSGHEPLASQAGKYPRDLDITPRFQRYA